MKKIISKLFPNLVMEFHQDGVNRYIEKWLYDEKFRELVHLYEGDDGIHRYKVVFEENQ